MNKNRVILGRNIELEGRDQPSVSPLTPHYVTEHVMSNQAIVRAQVTQLVPPHTLDTETMVRLDHTDTTANHGIYVGANRDAYVRALEGEAEPQEPEHPTDEPHEPEHPVEHWPHQVELMFEGAESEETEVEATFHEDRTVTFSCKLPKGTHLSVHVLAGEGGVREHDGVLDVQEGVSAVEIAVVDETGHELTHGVLDTTEGEHELHLVAEGHESAEHAAEELEHLRHEMEEAEEKREEERERLNEALEEIVEQEREHAQEHMLEHAREAAEEAAEHAREHMEEEEMERLKHEKEHGGHHEHHHHHEHGEHGFSLDATFNNETREINLMVEGGLNTVEVEIDSGEGEIKKTEGPYLGFSKYKVAPGVKKVKITVKDKAGKVIFKDFLYTNGTKSEIHRKQEGHGHEEHGKDGHGEKHEKKDGHDTPGKHADPHHHAPELDDEAVESAPVETATDTAKVEVSADVASRTVEESKEETSNAQTGVVAALASAAAFLGLRRRKAKKAA